MAKRKNTYLRLLKTAFTVLIVHSLFSVTISAAELYVRTSSGECSRTRLKFQIEQLDKLPASIIFAIYDRATGDLVVAQTKVVLQNGEYTWTGLIPFNEYKAAVSLPGIKKPLQDEFNNNDMLAHFLDKGSEYFQLRNGSDKKKDIARISPNLREDIPLGLSSNSIVKMHLLLIGNNNKLAWEYLGEPILKWSPSASGWYKLVVIRYEKDESKCTVGST